MFLFRTAISSIKKVLLDDFNPTRIINTQICGHFLYSYSCRVNIEWILQLDQPNGFTYLRAYVSNTLCVFACKSLFDICKQTRHFDILAYLHSTLNYYETFFKAVKI